jgi:hypothetical protein
MLAFRIPATDPYSRDLARSKSLYTGFTPRFPSAIVAEWQIAEVLS